MSVTILTANNFNHVCIWIPMNSHSHVCIVFDSLRPCNLTHHRWFILVRYVVCRCSGNINNRNIICHSKQFNPCSAALRAAASAAICAANGVDLRDPLNPTWPEDDQAITPPAGSVIETMVLLKVLFIYAWPKATFFLSFLRALIFFGAAFAASLTAFVFKVYTLFTVKLSIEYVIEQAILFLVF